jgi:pyruvate kinase
MPKESTAMIVSKIETMKGMEDIEKIVNVSDAIMVARGDLGLAVPMEEIPFLQKKIIDLCRLKAKPVITATQMLESMTTNPIPTRAEVTDVANAILDGTDAVMLSGETAAGDFPVETVKMMRKIIRHAVPHVSPSTYKHETRSIAHAIGLSAGTIANEVEAKMIVVFTESGLSARRVSRHRHSQFILALSPNQASVRKLCFSAGVYPILIDQTKDFEHMIEQAKNYAKDNDVIPAESGDPLVIVAGLPLGKKGTTNMIYVERA